MFFIIDVLGSMYGNDLVKYWIEVVWFLVCEFVVFVEVNPDVDFWVVSIFFSYGVFLYSIMIFIFL